MRANNSFQLPEITDDDISHATQLLGLPVGAFYGPDGNDPRQDALKRMDTIDVAACPGSGKTTLLVAKLAILAKKWSSSTRGICVLSHTNSARHEIEKHLGNTSEGQKLLSYPHYIGTIHGFINEFLALPFLRSKGYEVNVIDTEICRKKRWFLLPVKTRKALENAKHNSSVLSIKDADFGVGEVSWSGSTLGLNTETYRELVNACKLSTMDGYFCHDEMFLWATELMKTSADVAITLRDRFPILLVDEAQDNSLEQTEILSRIFINSGSPIVRQRYGDANQAIYDFQGAEESLKDAFPAPNPIELPNSYRFGQSIASLADPLGLKPYGLKGAGPKYSLDSDLYDRNIIFLFEESNAGKLLGAYGDLILDVFSEQEVNSGWFKAYAVGGIHTPPKKEESHKYPHHIKHYMNAYDHQLNKYEPKLGTFLQYISVGKDLSQTVGETYPMVEKIAEALLRLSSYSTEQKVIEKRRNKHRYILDLLIQESDQKEIYLRLIKKLSVERYFPSKDEWETKWCKYIKRLAEKIAGANELNLEADEFLRWDDYSYISTQDGLANKTQNNIFLHNKNGRNVPIKVGSIHSVKGQTHTATLVLETFWHEHNLEKLLPWLQGGKKGWETGERQKSRLKSHYVAMTRPTHLLCLGMKKSSVDNNAKVLLKKNGWEIREILNGCQITN
ncbi:MAG: UvrD-helicase domain-containing protein [Pseudomonadales bacterium]|nr:UvrD-helicase domain-containing protein [Pseudomonadales bacterium]